MITFLKDAKSAGTRQQTPSGVVLYVSGGQHADIQYRQHTRGYVELASRRFYVVNTRRRYATLDAAAAAVAALKP